MSDKNAPDVPSELIALQCASNAEFLKVRAFNEHGPTLQWSDELHAEWKAQWEAWRVAAEAVYEAVCNHPAAAEMGRYTLEMAVKAAARAAALTASTASHDLAA
ncbi:hypothetical protein ACFY1P_29580 [Streptomyces sp. NPDC001407]|uniref:hypothetical protein n=1 Tax=unclassified Streptomyces TaxID=2593676 RepID=UPI0036817C1C